MQNLRTAVLELLKSKNENAMIRPDGRCRVLQNGAWIDAGCVGDYAPQFAPQRGGEIAIDAMDNGYGKLD